MTLDHPKPEVSVLICNYNRADDVIRAISSALAQRNVELEIILMDDCSTDGTVEKVSARFPSTRVYSSPTNLGYIQQRNRGVSLANSNLVVFLDNDAYFSSPHTLHQLAAYLTDKSDIATVALPFLEPIVDVGAAGSWPDGQPSVEVRSFVGCAAAVRRDFFQEIGGFRVLYKHYGEESDFCLRLLQRNLKTVFLPLPPIVHCVSPQRDRTRSQTMGIRSTFLFQVLNVPFPDIAMRLPYAILQRFRWKLTLKDTFGRVWLIVRLLAECLGHWNMRSPVRSDVFRRFVSLPSCGGRRLPSAELPPPC